MSLRSQVFWAGKALDTRHPVDGAVQPPLPVRVSRCRVLLADQVGSSVVPFVPGVGVLGLEPFGPAADRKPDQFDVLFAGQRGELRPEIAPLVHGQRLAARRRSGR